MLWTFVIGALFAIMLLYDHVAWIRRLLGTTRGTVGFGILILASPLLLLAYLIERRGK